MARATEVAVEEMRYALRNALDLNANPREVNRQVDEAWNVLYSFESPPERVVGVDFVIASLEISRRHAAKWVVLQASQRGEHPDFSEQPTPSVHIPVLAAPSRKEDSIVIPCLMDRTESNLYAYSLPLRDAYGVPVPIEQEIIFTVFDRTPADV